MSTLPSETNDAGSPPYTPQDCPKWDKCSAPICPLDPLRFQRTMYPEDPVCIYLLETLKANAESNFKAVGLAWLRREILGTTDELESHFPSIRIRASRARETGSKMSAGRALKGVAE